MRSSPQDLMPSNALIKVGKISKAIDLQNGMQAARQLDLVVRLDWNGPGDLDLLIEEPTGSKCSMDNPSTSSGGIFVHDGFGPNQARCYDEYLCPKAISGDYVAHVRHVWGDIVGKRARLTITRGKNSPREQLEIQSVLLGRTDQKIRFSLAKGSRLEADQAIPEPLQKQSGRQHATGNAILAQIDGNTGSPLAARSIGLGAGNNVGYQPGCHDDCDRGRVGRSTVRANFNGTRLHQNYGCVYVQRP